MNINQIYMQRALDLANLGRGKTSPNPMVGCVIVKGSKIIGEGYYKRYGGLHAEIEAFKTVNDKSLLKDAQLFVNLEPCCHYGKTPPCSQAIIKYGLGEVYIANTDPNPLVFKSIQEMEYAGIKVIKGILRQKGEILNSAFFCFHRQKKPYIILKWAETSDRFLSRLDHSSKWISNWLSRKLVHKWRSEVDAILVGSNTIFYDDPKLTTRHWLGKNPLRVIIDKTLRLAPANHIFDQSTPTICYNLKKSLEVNNLIYVCLEEQNFLQNLIDDLYRRDIQTLLVEGGSTLHKSFLKLSLWNELRIFQSKQAFGTGIKAPEASGILSKRINILEDELSIWLNHT